MISPRQIAANRANAQKSSGPKTAAGKARSSRNSLKHGLLSRELVLPWEDEREYRRLLKALLDEHGPEGATETLLVEQMAIAMWKLARLAGIEAAVLHQRLDDSLRLSSLAALPKEERFQAALSFILPPNQQVLLNHENQLNKGFYRALATLKRLQTERRTLPGEASPAD